MNGLYLAGAERREGRDVEEQSGSYLSGPGPPASCWSGRDDEDRRLHPPPPPGRHPKTESDRDSNNLLIISTSQAVPLSPSISRNVVKLGQVGSCS